MVLLASGVRGGPREGGESESGQTGKHSHPELKWPPAAPLPSVLTPRPASLCRGQRLPPNTARSVPAQAARVGVPTAADGEAGMHAGQWGVPEVAAHANLAEIKKMP